jgi:bifunctional non-homologous end joining protein LigD
MRILPPGFIPPCLSTKAPRPPAAGEWLHEIKHDGFRVIARKAGEQVRLYSRPGNDLTARFPLIVEALARLRSRSCIIDGEAVACDDDGIASFDLLRHRRRDARVFLYAFDLVELNGDDLRRYPLERRKADLARLLAPTRPGLRLNDWLEGIVSKRKGSRYRSGRSEDRLKSKNPACAAVKREAEEDWGRQWPRKR